MACELPARYERPLSRLFVPDIVEILLQEELLDHISASTVWRILDADALKPWRRRSWIYPRDPQFYARAGPVLDLYAGFWQGKPLRKAEFVLSADEKTSIQARRVFWIVDGGSSHHRSTFPDRLRSAYPHAEAVFPPVHASWLNQIEIYLSILQRKVLTPNDLAGPPQARDRLLAFGEEFRRRAEPFDWNFTRQDLRRWLKKFPKIHATPDTNKARKHAA